MANESGVLRRSPAKEADRDQADEDFGLRSALGVLLEQEIRKSGLSLSEFSRRAGVLPATVSKLVNGEQRSVNQKTMQKLATFLGRKVWHIEFLGAQEPLDADHMPEPHVPPAVAELLCSIEGAIDADPRIPPKRKRWLKQCVQLARSAG